jgi:O-antigen/teichoic acid export membrane protein
VPEQTTRSAPASNLIRSGVVYAVANVLAAGVPFFLLPVLTRALQPEEYAVVVSFYMLVALCAGFAGLSVQSAVGVQWMSRAREDARHVTGSAIVVALLSAALAAAVSALIAPRWFAELPPALCAMAALVAGCTTLQSMRFAVWQSCHRPLPAATLQVSSAALNIGLSLLAVLAFNMGGAGRALGAALAGVAAASVSVLLLVTARPARRAPPTRGCCCASACLCCRMPLPARCWSTSIVWPWPTAQDRRHSASMAQPRSLAWCSTCWPMR